MIRSVLNVKGGVGKTTTVFNLGAGLAKAGKKTLLVDFDGQHTLTTILLDKEFSEDDNTIVKVLLKGDDPKECIYPTKIENLYILPSSLYLFAIERLLQTSTTGGQITKLKKILKQLTDFEEVVIDNNPSLNLCASNSICASDEIIIPTKIDIGSIRGIDLTINQINDVVDAMDMVGINYKILVNMKDRNNTDKDFINELNEKYGDKVYKTKIRYQAKPVKDSGFNSLPLISNSNAAVAKEFEAFVDEVLKGENK